MQVMEEGVPGARVIVADCPSQHYLPSLLRSTQFQQAGSAAAGGVTCVVHLTPAEVSLTDHQQTQYAMQTYTLC